MKAILSFLLLFSGLAKGQTAPGHRVLVALTISYQPDQMGTADQYYLIAKKPECVKINLNQTFLLQSAWHKEGDSVVNIGQGIAKIINDTDVELSATVYPGKKIEIGDMAMFLVPLTQPKEDTLFYKLARLDIGFMTVEGVPFYDRSEMLQTPEKYKANTLLEEMAKDIRKTGQAMIDQKNNQDQVIKKGIYKDETLFNLMTKITADDVEKFIKYVYVKPNKYKAHQWKISETFATWAINGAP